jgi:delta-aminolevulinic acid dehydratase/porphobilinogen synthase
MNLANYQKALIETRLDKAESVDILMVHLAS